MFIHGANVSNPIFNIANMHKLPLMPSNTQGSYHLSSGHRIDNQFGDSISKEIAQLEDEAEKLERKPDGESLEEYLNRGFLDVMKKQVPAEQHDQARAVFNYNKKSLSSYYGDDISKISAWGMGTYDTIPGNLQFVNGTEDIVRIITDDIGAKVVYLRHEVEQIDWTKQPVKVTCRIISGDGFDADATRSLSVRSCNCHRFTWSFANGDGQFISAQTA